MFRGIRAAAAAGLFLCAAAAGADLPAFPLPREGEPPLSIECERMERSGRDAAAGPEEGASGEAVRLGGEGSEVRAILRGADGVYRFALHARGEADPRDALYFRVDGGQIRLVLKHDPFGDGEAGASVTVHVRGCPEETEFPVVLSAAEPGIHLDRLAVTRLPLTPEAFSDQEAAARSEHGAALSSEPHQFLEVRPRPPTLALPPTPPFFVPSEPRVSVEGEELVRLGADVARWPHADASGRRVVFLPGWGEGRVAGFANLPAGVYRVEITGGAWDGREDMGMELSLAGESCRLTFDDDDLQTTASAVYLRCRRDGDYAFELRSRGHSVVIDRVEFTPADLTDEEFNEERGGWMELDEEDRLEEDAYLDAQPHRPD